MNFWNNKLEYLFNLESTIELLNLKLSTLQNRQSEAGYRLLKSKFCIHFTIAISSYIKIDFRFQEKVFYVRIETNIVLVLVATCSTYM